MDALLELHLPAEARSAGIARHAVERRLRGHLDEETLLDVELLVSELVTNGVLHGPKSDSTIDVSLCLDSSGLLVEVRDRGTGFDPDEVRSRAKKPTGGWGLTLVERIADRWGIRPEPDAAAVWFRIGRAS